MISENSTHLDMEFKNCLDRALSMANLTLVHLAKIASLSRQHLTALKGKKDSMPSIKAIYGVCDVLKNDYDVDETLLIPLVCSALNRGSKGKKLISETILQNIPHPPDFRSQAKNLESRCIITDSLLECLYEDVLTETLELMKRGITFYYFLPIRSRDWHRMIVKAAYLKKENRQLIKKKSYCLKSSINDFLYPRIRIDNIDTPKPEAYINLGTASAPILQELQPDIAHPLIDSIQVIIDKIKLARKDGESTVSFRDEGIELAIRLEDETII